jgi:hypothetical protein
VENTSQSSSFPRSIRKTNPALIAEDGISGKWKREATMTKRIHEFEVIGNRPFPLDMLRYDSCYPKTQDCIGDILVSMDPDPDEQTGEYYVKLIHVDDSPRWEPTIARWNSFGWAVRRI